MSIYAQAITSGITALAGTEADRVYGETYNTVAQREAQKSNMRRAIQTAQYNIAAVNQDKVLTNLQIQMNQDQAEAQAKVAAATAGVEGGSVDDVMYETEKNEAMAINNANRQAELQTDSLLAQVGSQMNSLLSVNDALPEISYVDNLLGAFSSFEMKDFKTGEAIANGDWDSVFGG